MELDEQTRKELQLELCRIDFWSFCQMLMPNFYKEDRAYLHEFCDKLQDFVVNSEKRFLIVNLPPRHGKSLTAQNLTAWLFGRNNKTKVMTASYNEKLSTTFAKNVRNTIQTQKVGERVVYNDIFPDTQVKYGDASASMWSLEGSNSANYIATSPTSTATGFGANFLIVDDIIKSAEDAYNENTLEAHKVWFHNTFMSRTENPWKVIIIMTRWAERDLAGQVLHAFGEDVELITYKAKDENDNMLCEDILSLKDYKLKTQEMNPDIVEANYNQQPIDVKGRLYSEFKTWEKYPEKFVIKNYTDTADTGSDYLCSINYYVFENEAYITDLVFSDKSMEFTEPAVADLLFNGDCAEATIESNNGGRGFARNVERIIRDKFSSNKTVIRTKPQTHNKESRILSSSAWVQNHVYMPLNWRTRYPEFYNQVMSYQRKGKNAHDDSVDVLAAIYEAITATGEPQIITDLDMGGARRRRAFERGF